MEGLGILLYYGGIAGIILLVTFLYQRRKYYQLFSDNGIPGPPPNLLMGNLRATRNPNKTIMVTMAEWEKEYGSVYGYFVGMRPIVVIRNLEAIKELFIKNFSITTNRSRLIVETYPLKHTLVGLRGQRWKEVRQILTPTFSSSKMRQLFSLIGKSVTVALNILYEKKGEEFEVYSFFQGLTCQVIAECALAMKVDCQRNLNDEFMLAVRGFLENALSPIITFGLCFPGFGTLMGFLVEKFSLSGQMTDIVCNHVKRVIKYRQNMNETLPNVDVLQLMLDSRKNQANPAKYLSEDEIVANSWVFLLGGFETTAAALSFTTYLLALNQDIQDKLFNELENAFPGEEVPTYDDANKLEYLDMVVHEALRLFPPVVTFVSRQLDETVTIDSKVIPAGVTVQVPVWNIHYDPEYWPDPTAFKPERFSPENKKNLHPITWIPFGIGPRTCMGMRFSFIEIKLTLAKMVRLFRVLPTDRTELDIQLKVPTVTLVPKEGIYLRCVKR